MPKRRFVICFDGTWNTPDSGKNPTNVVKILRAVRNQVENVSQVTFYDKGVGTGGPIDRLRGGASGEGLTGNMVDGYRFLANNFQSEDEIYVFGFSRGAFTARSLVGFISLVGIIRPSALDTGVGQALAVYRNKDLDSDQKREQIEALNLDRLSDIRIRCVGVWDTVGSLGVPGDLGRRFSKHLYFHDVQLSSKVDVALHAVAIDEKRSAFAPTLWVRKEGVNATEGQKIEQVWFPGVHSNIGGSYLDARLSDNTLDWMIKRVSNLTDLEFDEQFMAQHIRLDSLGDGIDSRTTLYKDSVIYPYQRLINQIIPTGSAVGDWFRKTFPSLDRRNIPPDQLVPINEMLHISALERWGRSVVHDGQHDVRYRPSNLEAAIRAHGSEQSVPVVGWDGGTSSDSDAPWPEL